MKYILVYHKDRIADIADDCGYIDHPADPAVHVSRSNIKYILVYYKDRIADYIYDSKTFNKRVSEANTCGPGNIVGGTGKGTFDSPVP